MIHMLGDGSCEHLVWAIELVLGDIEERFVVIGPCHVPSSVLCDT